MSDLVDELRARANDMREEGVGGWADTCLAAADHIALLEAERDGTCELNESLMGFIAKQNARIAELEGTIGLERIELHHAKARIKELEAQELGFIHTLCVQSEELKEARERIALLEAEVAELRLQLLTALVPDGYEVEEKEDE